MGIRGIVGRAITMDKQSYTVVGRDDANGF